MESALKANVKRILARQSARIILLLVYECQGQLTPQGRTKLRERVTVEHTLAHVGHWQGRRARYRGTRKNLFDLRRCAVIYNLHVLARSQQLQEELQAVA